MYNNIPSELKSLKQWVCWKGIPDPVRDGKIKKIPINPYTGGQAQSNNVDTWTDFQTAVQESVKYNGIGFMFNDNGYFGVDLDGVDEDLKSFQQDKDEGIVAEFIHTLQSYSELSQSGKGIHIICKGNLPAGGRRKKNVEMYQSGRFFIMTGNICAEYAEIKDCTDVIKPLHEKYIGGGREPAQCISNNVDANLDIETILELAKKSKRGGMFADLFDGRWDSYFTSQSEADISFCNMLAFWTGKNAEKMDAIFRSSGLMRDKWDRRQTGSTYGAITINKAIATCTNTYAPKNNGMGFNISFGNGGESESQPIKLNTFDDMGNAERIIDKFGTKIRYNHIDKQWLYYDERRWQYDDTGAVLRIADVVIEDMKAEVEVYKAKDDESGGDMAKQFAKHMKMSRSSRGKASMVKECQHRIPIKHEWFDRDKWLINTPNGIINLKSGEISPHRCEAYMTRITSSGYTDKADCSKWLAFLNDIFKGDTDLIRYIQKAVGYSLTGSTDEQCAFFLYGTGRNGKSTFMDIIREIFGNYSTNIQPETIMVRNNKNSNSASSDIARLKGARLVVTAEPNEGVRINEGLLKQLTGEDTVTARFLFGGEFEFKPEFKLWMATNHKPIIRGLDTGIWRRIHMIPFENEIPLDQVDRHLKYKLRQELPAIFKWAVDGCLLYQREGLKMPQSVLDAVKEYKGEMDVISNFIDGCCTLGGEVQASKLYKVYSEWAKENNEYCMSSTKFGIEVSKRFGKYKKRTVGAIYQGISVSTYTGFGF